MFTRLALTKQMRKIFLQEEHVIANETFSDQSSR